MTRAKKKTVETFFLSRLISGIHNSRFQALIKMRFRSKKKKQISIHHFCFAFFGTVYRTDIIQHACMQKKKTAKSKFCLVFLRKIIFITIILSINDPKRKKCKLEICTIKKNYYC